MHRSPLIGSTSMEQAVTTTNIPFGAKCHGVTGLTRRRHGGQRFVLANLGVLEEVDRIWNLDGVPPKSAAALRKFSWQLGCGNAAPIAAYISGRQTLNNMSWMPGLSSASNVRVVSNSVVKNLPPTRGKSRQATLRRSTCSTTYQVIVGDGKWVGRLLPSTSIRRRRCQRKSLTHPPDCGATSTTCSTESDTTTP